MSARRYSEDEARQIFDRAARADPDGGRGGEPASDPTGLSLQELQDIGAEVGLPAEAIARAAAALGAPAAGQRIEHLGMPVGVSHSVALGRSLSDADWHQLVGTLRRTFRASGQTEVTPTFREWWNGNLRVTVERTGGGDVLHMFTQKTGAKELTLSGGAALLFGAAMTLMLVMAGKFVTDPELIVLPIMFGAGGLGMIVTNVFRLRGWSARRREQFQALAQRLIAAPPAPPQVSLSPGEEAPLQPDG